MTYKITTSSPPCPSPNGEVRHRTGNSLSYNAVRYPLPFQEEAK